MKNTTVQVLLVLLCLGQMSSAAGKKTVYAVAKVDGRTKKIDGQEYQLVAIKLEPHVLLLNSGLGASVLLINGCHGKTALEEGDKERKLDDGTYRVRLMWLRLPDTGEIEVLWGGLSDPKEKDKELRARLVKAGYVPLAVDVEKLATVKAGNAKELASALDKLAEPSK